MVEVGPFEEGMDEEIEQVPSVENQGPPRMRSRKQAFREDNGGDEDGEGG